MIIEEKSREKKGLLKDIADIIILVEVLKYQILLILLESKCK